MAKFKELNLQLEDNEKIKLGDSQDAEISYNGTDLVINSSTGNVTISGGGGTGIVGVPAGAVMSFALPSTPAGWLECDGSAISRTTYSGLFSGIGEMYGNGDGSTTFNLPDYRGEFLRGFDNTASNDPNAATRTDRGDGETGDKVGTKQGEGFKQHGHKNKYSTTYDGYGGIGGGWQSNWTGSQQQGTTTTEYIVNSLDSTAGDETRPRNVYVLYCIKY